MGRATGKLGRDTRGAVAPTVALSLFALIGASGLAFDYARLASLDTELQNAADQAALAAASQLDGQAGATARAIAAAQTLLANQTLFANDDGDVTIATGTSDSGTDANGAEVTTRLRVNFYSNRDDAEDDSNSFTSAAAGADALAKFVKVEVAGREAIYALTPVVGAFRSGLIEAAATAGLGSSICKVPPLMLCNPQETGTNKDFDVGNYVGLGIRLVEGGSGSSWSPGNFGYLQTNMGPGASVLEYALGANSPPGECLGVDGVTTKPGENASVTDAINTRFDIYENGLTNDCTKGTCSPSPNVRKDVVRAAGSSNYGFKTGSDPWDLPSVKYLPSDTGPYVAPYPTSMGHPRDTCHAVAEGSASYCAKGRIGDGVWDRDLYFFVNHKALLGSPAPTAPNANWKTIPSLVTYASANGIANLNKITRFDVYKWEIQQDQLGPYADHSVTKGAKTTIYYNYGRPQSSAGLAAGPTQMDRRTTSMAVVNCLEENVQGQAKDVPVKKWVDLFFVEPSLARDRTSASDIYVEVIGETAAGATAPTNPQVVRRDVPYLIR